MNVEDFNDIISKTIGRYAHKAVEQSSTALVDLSDSGFMDSICANIDFPEKVQDMLLSAAIRTGISTEEILSDISSISNTKGQEYTNRSEDRLSNFKDAARRLGLTPIQVLKVYLDKHLCSIQTYIDDIVYGRVGIAYSEPMSGRYADAFLYTILLQALLMDVQQC